MAKKIYVVHEDLLYDTGKRFCEMTDEEVVKLCEQDTDREHHDVYDRVEDISANWNAEEFFYPSSSYMRVIDDGEPEYVWVFTATQACDDQALDTITEVFATEEAAHKHMHDFVYSEEGELDFAKKRGWTIEANTPDYYQAYEEGYYNGNHVEAQINKFEVKH